MIVDPPYESERGWTSVYTRTPGSGTATVLPLDEETKAEIVEREKRKLPLGFAAPQPKRRTRKR